MKINLTRKQAEEFEPVLVSVLFTKLASEIEKIREEDEMNFDFDSLRFCYIQKNHKFYLDPEENVEELNSMSMNSLKEFVLKNIMKEKFVFSIVIDSEPKKNKIGTELRTMVFGYDGDQHSINKDAIKTIINELFESEWFSRINSNSERLMAINCMFTIQPTMLPYDEFHYRNVSKNPISAIPDEIRDEITQYEKTGMLSDKMQNFLHVMSGGKEISEFGYITEENGEQRKLDSAEMARIIVQADRESVLSDVLMKKLEEFKEMIEQKIQEEESGVKPKQKELTLDELLDKVSERGIESLTEQEKERLDKLSGN